VGKIETGAMPVPVVIKGLTDWNDYHQLYGLDKTRQHIISQLEKAMNEKEDSELCLNSRVELENKNTIDISYEGIHKRFAVATGKGACILDKKTRGFMSTTDLSVTVGNELYRKYINDEQTERIPKENIVFDPTVTVDREGYFNTFTTFPIKPKEGECSNILELLFLICEIDKTVFEWVLRWFAYPLQNPGAKMRTAIVMHGAGGVGKNLFLSVMQAIYGEYSVIITQTDLASSFNGWASKKLFGIGNEVSTHKGMYDLAGVMKNMITEPEWNINEKNINVRKESNLTNFVFTSNHQQPVVADKDDRRYLVLWMLPKKDKSFYKSVAHERDNGGIEAFYYYLMHLDLGDFDEYTEPVITRSKKDLIQLSMNSDEKFINDWLSGEFVIPLMPCLTDDLFKFYQKWSRYRGEKFTVSMTEFGTRIGKCADQLIKLKNQRYKIGVREHKGTFVFHMDSEQPEGVNKIDWLTDCRKVFIESVNGWNELHDV